MAEFEEPTIKPLISDTLYDKLKFTAQVILPGLGALYFALAQIWGLPYGEEVVGTITAVDAFLGLFLIKATSRYEESDEWYDGYVPAESLPDELAGRRKVTMRVKRDM